MNDTNYPKIDEVSDATSYIDDTVKAGTKYYYLVRPVFNDGTAGEYSKPISGVALGKTNLTKIKAKSVKKIKMDDKPIEHEVVRSINVYFITFMIIFVASVIAISFEGHDLVTNFTAIAATINNIGPGLSMVGPDCNFGFFSDFSKLVIIFDMLAGRLELFPLLILFHPAIWKELFTQKITMRRKKKF